MAVLTMALALAGCANEGMPGVGAGFAAPGITTGAVAAYAPAGDGAGEVAPRKTLASKVLAAIALERVTGRKPDPARLTEGL